MEGRRRYWSGQQVMVRVLDLVLAGTECRERAKLRLSLVVDDSTFLRRGDSRSGLDSNVGVSWPGKTILVLP